MQTREYSTEGFNKIHEVKKFKRFESLFICEEALAVIIFNKQCRFISSELNRVETHFGSTQFTQKTRTALAEIILHDSGVLENIHFVFDDELITFFESGAFGKTLLFVAHVHQFMNPLLTQIFDPT
jgi:hypothetical protein